MHIILGLIGLAAAAGFWIWRLRAAAEAGSQVIGAAKDVRAAARRFGFRRRTNVHPVDSIDDARVAAAAILAALVVQDHLTEAERRTTSIVQMQSVFEVTKTEAEELYALGHWLVAQCSGPGIAVPRLARKLNALAGVAAQPDLERMIAAVWADQSGTMPEHVLEGLDDIRQKFPAA